MRVTLYRLTPETLARYRDARRWPTSARCPDCKQRMERVEVDRVTDLYICPDGFGYYRHVRSRTEDGGGTGRDLG